MRVLVREIEKNENQTIELMGWVENRRDHGKLIFIDFRDRSGTAQIVFVPAVMKEGQEIASRLRSEWVVRVVGEAKRRPKGMENPDVPCGAFEVTATELEVLSEAATPPFPLTTEGYDIEEEVRLKYRYLDLRRERMRKNIRLRHKVTSLAREYLDNNDFVEIETPLLSKASPEGARDFLVPSRLQQGKFFALPQAPQQYKQLLMIAGFERYYQIARALRDEDLRGDRQFEHTQIDLEMSFVSEGDVRAMVEGMMIHIAESCGKKIWKKPFPVFTHEEATEKFGADKFDLRDEPKDKNTLAFAWVIDFPLFEFDKNTKRFIFAHNPFSAPKSEHVDKLMQGKDLEILRAQQYDLVCNGLELASGGVRISNPEVQRKVFEVMGLNNEEIETRFGHMLEAYTFGAPPHAGMAPGLDRLVSVLAGESAISEVIAFPKTRGGRDPMMDAPSEVSSEQLRELGLSIKKK